MNLKDFNWEETKTILELGNVQLSLNDFQNISKRTMPKGDFEKDITNYTLGYVCEAGEFGDHIKKHVFHGHELDREYAIKELGDGLHYLSGLATLLGVTLEEVATTNIDKLMKRYKDGFSKEASIKRVDTK